MSNLPNPYDEINKKEIREKYYNGFRNKAIRIYYYLDRGLDLMNQFKYLVAGILAFYYFLKVDSIKIMLFMFIGAIPILIGGGYLWTRHGLKVIEYLNLKLATHFGQYGIRLQEKQNESMDKQIQILEQLCKSIDKLNKKLNKS